jgi:hypothetical protein
VSLGTDKVLDGDLDVVQIDVSGTGGLATTDVDAGHVDTLGVLKRNDKKGEATGAGAASADGHGGVVGEDTVGDPLTYLATVYDNGGRGVDIPLLGTIKDVVLAVLGLLGGGLDVCDIRTCSWLRNGATKRLRSCLLPNLMMGGTPKAKPTVTDPAGPPVPQRASLER